MGIELETSPVTAPKRKYTHRRSPEERRRLTAKQQTVYDLRQSGKTFKEISAIVGRGLQTVVECYRTAERKVLNHKTDENQLPPHIRPIEERLDPMDAAQAIDRLTDPFTKLSAVAQECGLKP